MATKIPAGADASISSAVSPPETRDAGDRPPSRVGTARKGLLALLDQAFVSGSRFATSVLIGRFAGEEQLGFYSLGFSLLVTVICVQESLITSPYTVLHARRTGVDWRRYNGSVLLHVLALSLIASVSFTVGWLMTRGRDATGFPTVLAMLAVTTPFTLLREFARRVEFARLRLGMANWVDGSVTALQVALLGFLAWRDQLSAHTAFLVVGVSAAFIGAFWLVASRRIFRAAIADALEHLRDGWRMGRWVFLAQLTGLIHLQGMFWLIAAIDGTTQTGIFAACSTLVMFVNPFALGLNNFIGPLNVKAATEGGLVGARRLTRRAMAFMGAAILMFSLLLFLFSDTILLTLFDKASYAGNQWLILILGVNLTFNAMHMVNEGGLWAIERPQPIFWCTLIAVLVTFVPAYPMILAFGLVGAALALVAGRLAALVVCSVVFFFLIDSPMKRMPAPPV